MEYQKTVKKYLLILLGIVVLAFVAAWVIGNQPNGVSKAPKASLNTGTQSQDPYNKFPTNIPIETGAELTKNSNSSSEEGLFQGTRVFQSSKTIDENLKIYEDFLAADNWNVTNRIDRGANKTLLASKDGARLQIALDSATSGNTQSVTVSISYMLIAQSTN
jgi:hypothetical protein